MTTTLYHFQQFYIQSGWTISIFYSRCFNVWQLKRQTRPNIKCWLELEIFHCCTPIWSQFTVEQCLNLRKISSWLNADKSLRTPKLIIKIKETKQRFRLFTKFSEFIRLCRFELKPAPGLYSKSFALLV